MLGGVKEANYFVAFEITLMQRAMIHIHIYIYIELSYNYRL